MKHKKPYEISPYLIVSIILLIICIIAIFEYQNLSKSYDTLVTDTKDTTDLRKELAIELSDLENTTVTKKESNDLIITNMDIELNEANQLVEDYQQKLTDYKNELSPYKKLVNSLDIDDNEILSPYISASLNGINDTK